jgi:hypothetical protein
MVKQEITHKTQKMVTIAKHGQNMSALKINPVREWVAATAFIGI